MNEPFDDATECSSLPVAGDLIGEGIVVPLDELHTFSQHPFKVVHDEAMQALVESIRRNGVLNRIIVRPRKEGGFEIIAGHRRVEACRILGLEVIPADLREMDDDAAVIAMVETNLKQRPKLLPSERARAYRMMRDALSHRGSRTDIKETKIQHTNKTISDCYGDSPRQVARFIRLTELSDKLLDTLDAGGLKLGIAVEISHLHDEAREWIEDHYNAEREFPNAKQLREMRRLMEENALSLASFEEIMLQEPQSKQPESDFLDSLRAEHFPNLTIDDVKQKIQELVDDYLRRRRLGR